MQSTHTGQSIPMTQLVRTGAVVARIGESDLYSVEFPARGEVGPVGAIWRIETADREPSPGRIGSTTA